MADIKTEVIRLRVTEDQKKQIQAAAESENRTLSNYLLAAALEKLKIGNASGSEN